MLPVKTNGELRTVVITAEKRKGYVELSPQPVTMYEVSYVKRTPSPIRVCPKMGNASYRGMTFLLR